MTAWLVNLLVTLLRALLPALAEQMRSTSEEGKRRPELRKRLQKRIRSTWGPGAIALLLAAVLLTSGCGSRTIYVPTGEPVRLRQTIRNAKVWVVDKDGRPVAGRMDLPEGWYILPDPGPDES